MKSLMAPCTAATMLDAPVAIAQSGARVYQIRSLTKLLYLGTAISIALFHVCVLRGPLQPDGPLPPDMLRNYAIGRTLLDAGILLLIAIILGYVYRLHRYRLHVDDSGIRRDDANTSLAWNEIRDISTNRSGQLQLRGLSATRRVEIYNSTANIEQLGETIFHHCHDLLPGHAAPIPYSIGSNPLIQHLLALVTKALFVLWTSLYAFHTQHIIMLAFGVAVVMAAGMRLYYRGRRAYYGYCHIDRTTLRIGTGWNHFVLYPDDIATVQLTLSEHGPQIIITATPEHQNKQIKVHAFKDQTFEVYQTIKAWANK